MTFSVKELLSIAGKFRALQPPKVLNRNHGGSGIYVGRPSKFGNPYQIGIDGSREEVIESYRVYLNDRPNLIEDVRRELRGYNLICHCAPLACHADILLKIANEV